jgi:transposase
MRRYALRDDQWDRIKDFLPRAMSAARRRTIGCSSRRFCTGIEPAFHGVIFRSVGDWKIVHQRFSRWARSGVFERIFNMLASDHDNEYMMIDATIVRAHQHSAGARKKTANKRSADHAAD